MLDRRHFSGCDTSVTTVNQTISTRLKRVALVGFFALIGWCMGWLVATVSIEAAMVSPKSLDVDFFTRRVPLPHHVPEHTDGVSFRFAMVQDILHERFARHGSAYYAERNRLVNDRLKALEPGDPARLPLLDDLGVGLERLGQSHEAIELLRAKLSEQQQLGLSGRELYTSYANLGTFLIHDNLTPGMNGDQSARDRFAEGVDLIRDAVRVNPEAHFGRERWQAVVAEFLLAAMANPQILRQTDCLGNRLDLDIESMLNRNAHWVEHGGYGRPTSPNFSQWRSEDNVPEFFRPGVRPADPALWPKLHSIRDEITKVGAEEGWQEIAVPSLDAPVPFDEPMLGIIGMWRQGGGANPHFALALGETMLRVGQRRLAWAAFERAGRMADRFWPDPDLKTFLHAHCLGRQAEIEATLAVAAVNQEQSRDIPWQQVSPPHLDDNSAQLRARFDAELAFGTGYQQRFQEYEQDQINIGASVDSPHFDDRFSAGPIPIASPVGDEEWFVGISRERIRAYGSELRNAYGLLGAGLMALVVELISRVKTWLGSTGRKLSHRARARKT